MSLVDEVMAQHRPEPDSQADYDNCSGCSGTFPCVPFQLATELQAARAVVEAAREANLNCRRCGAPRIGHGQVGLCGGFKHEVTEALARYDEGRTQ